MQKTTKPRLVIMTLRFVQKNYSQLGRDNIPIYPP